VLRPGRAEDHEAFARLFGELGVEDPPPPLAVWTAEIAPRAVFVEGPSGVLAYAVTETLGELGYVQQLVVDASARNRGLGRWVLRRVAERMRAEGCRQWTLNVKRDNAPALTLYTSLGMRPTRQAAALRVTRAQVAALPPVPPGLSVVPVGAGDLEGLTAAFGMLPGKLARFSQLASHRLMRLSHAGGPEGEVLGMMDQRAGGKVLFPFFAVSPGHARALVEAAFLHVGEAVESLAVVVTDDAPLERLLREAGATLSHETYELRGPLP
jgi:ribosomal protein S18 acetylase RimI-like enzyme